MKTITSNTEAEVVEKRSKFIGNLYYVESVEQAEEKIKEIKKKYNDARHSCFAYRICVQDSVVEKFSDDGEPSGTAGAPMLGLLSKLDLANCLAIVTRYFGGILLGTGGLVRAYTEATKQALEKAKIVDIQSGEEILITLSYNKLGEFQYYCQKNDIKIVSVEYEENITCKIQVTTAQKEKIVNETIKKQYNISNIEVTKEKYITNNN